MAALNPRRVLCVAVACTKSAVIPRNRSKPNGWGFYHYLVNRADGRTAIPVDPLPAQPGLLCPACLKREQAALHEFDLAQARRRLEAQEAAQRAAQEAEEASRKAAQEAEKARRAARPPEGFQSWAPEVIADASGKWCGNALRFGTLGEAEDNVRDLSFRWMLVRETRVVPSKDPVNYKWHPEAGLVPVPE